MEACESSESIWRRLGSCLCSVRHPILLIVAVGIIIRLVLMSASMVYDLDYWAVVIRNIESGEGLYDAEGYYYTPVWGYVLGFIAACQSMFLELGEVAIRVLEAFPVEIIPDTYYTATAPSIAFIYSVKIPLMIFDLILAYLVMVLAKDYTGDSRKAVLAFAFTFLFPVLMLSSGVIGMPDTIAAVFTVLTVVLLRRGMPFLAGASFSLAVLTKFFPVFLIFVFVAYLIVKHSHLIDFVKLARNRKWKLGKDVGVVVYNDEPVFEILDNGISVISTDFDMMGAVAAKFILTGERPQVYIPTRLILRGSL